MVDMAEYNREHELADKLNDFLTSCLGVADADYYSNMDFDSFMKLKSVLSNINNIITMKVTLSFIGWLAIQMNWTDEEKKVAIDSILSTKPNANGYDVELAIGGRSIIAEVKCNLPINGGYTYGAAQRHGIEKDVKSLMEGKSKSKMVPSECLKFVVFIDLLEIRKATQMCLDTRIDHGNSISFYRDGMSTDDTNKVYVVFVDNVTNG
jgi:hypothetical protein